MLTTDRSRSPRHLLGIAVLIVLVALTASNCFAQAAGARALNTPGEGSGLWKVLETGNLQFQGDSITFSGLKDLRRDLASHQDPHVTVLSCSDSRVPPELVFHQTLGDLFVIRAAGSVADTFGLASIEYGIAQGYTKLIVVLGHEDCGAVREALKEGDPPSPSLVALVNQIRTSFGNLPIPWRLTDAMVKAAVEANTQASAADLVARSPIIRKAVVFDRKVEIIAAYYDLHTGEVRRLK